VGNATNGRGLAINGATATARQPAGTSRLVPEFTIRRVQK
jgi:hypothetical protein